MAIFNEAFLDKFKKKTSSSSHPNNLYWVAKRKVDIGSSEEVLENNACTSPKEAMKFYMELMHNATISGSSVSIGKRNTKDMETATLYIYKLKVNEFVPGRNSNSFKCTVEKIEAAGTCMELLKKYGFSMGASSNVEEAREAEFKKVISMLRASVDEAKNKFSGIKIAIKDTKWYNESDEDEYEKFLSKGGSIDIATMDGSNEKDYGAYRHISRLLKQKVKESHEVDGTVGEDGYKHDCIIYYKSGIK